MTDHGKQQGTARILIVEYEAAAAEELAQSLGKLGYEVAGIVSTGEEAVPIVQESSPDLILMNINLPGEIDGIEVGRQIRARFDIPIVYLSSHAEKDVIARAKKTEPYGFPGKPIAFLELRSTIETALYKHQSDRRVKQGEENYRVLVETVPYGILETDNFGTITFANRGYCRMLGFTKEEMLEKSFLDFLPFESEREEVRAYLEYLVREQPIPVPWSGTHRTKDGRLISVLSEANYKRDSQGHVIGFIAVVTDITDRQNAEEARRESEELYRVLVETTNTGYVVVDDNGRVLAANSEYVRLTGHETVEQIIGRSVVEWTAGHDQGRNASEVAKCLRGGAVRNLEVDYVGREGVLIPVEINATVVGTGDDRRIMALCREISDRRKSEQLVKAQRDLGVALSGVCDLQEALDLCINKAVEVSGMAAAGAYVVDENSGFHLASQLGLSRELLRKVEHFPAQSPEAKIIAAGSPVYFFDHIPEKSPAFIEAPRREGFKAGAMIPILHQGIVVASLSLLSRKFDEIPAHIRIALEAISSRIGAAVSRLRAEETVRRVKEDLQESEQKYREVVDLANEAIVVTQDGRFVLVNPKATEITGLSEDVMLATPMLNLVHPDDRELVIRHHKMRMEGSKGQTEYNFRILNERGELKSLQMRTSLISWGGRNATLGLVSDVTENNRLEQELKKSLATASRLRTEAETASAATRIHGHLVRSCRVALRGPPIELSVTGAWAGNCGRWHV